jgi:GTP-binding protein HflX
MEQAVIVGLKGVASKPKELESLALSIGIETIKTFIVPLVKPSAPWLLGKGKTEEIIEWATDNEADMIIFNPPLSPSQQRNWEKASDLCVIDRHEVILEIFSQRAVTREAALQTGLARMEYSLPRLTRAWTHLSRQRGGTRGTRGEGETQLEIDRRIVLKKIARMKRDLDEIKKQRHTQRAKRINKGMSSSCIVGYTNAGKSSLLNRLCGTDIHAEDKLFATLDPTTRVLKLENGTKLTLTDTVGFIRDLPHKLVQAFHSTLEEAVLADFLIHVVDASDPDAASHYQTTLETLKEIHASDKRVLTVFNKIDCFAEDETHVFNIKRIQMEADKSVFCSVKTGEGITELQQAIEEMLREGRSETIFLFPPDQYKSVSRLYRECEILKEEYLDEGTRITTVCSESIRSRFSEYIVN